jgi:parallel beta-helix repeat protein
MRVFKIFMLGVVLLALAVGTSERAGLAQADCSIMVKPGESIQQAIEQAAEGAVICLSTGTWEENLAIQKSLTLRGAGKEPKEVRIVGAQDGHPVMRIESEIEVVIENLTVAEAKGDRCAVYDPQWICPAGLQALGKAKVLIKDVQVSDNGDYGLFVWESATVSLTNSQVSNNGDGLFVWESATVSLSHSTVSSNWTGLSVVHSAQVSLSHSQVFNNEYGGLVVEGGATVSLSHSTVSDNKGSGLFVRYSATVSLTNSQVSNNGDYGLFVMGSAQVSLSHSTVSGNGAGLDVRDYTLVTLEDSLIEGNGTDNPKCQQNDSICNGILVSMEAHLELRNTTIRNNTDWGLAAKLKQCDEAEDEDLFTGQVVFAGQNVIEGNNKSGKQNGKGNPGNHPWNRPDVPDGQVCLP